MIAHTCPPTLWVIVDDGSDDATPDILAEYTAQHSWIKVVAKPDRGHRAVGPGVIEAFYAGLNTVTTSDFSYLCKLDLDLDLPPRYFETLIERMEANPDIGTCSGKPYVRQGGKLVSERRGDEMSVGMTKFYRRQCFEGCVRTDQSTGGRSAPDRGDFPQCVLNEGAQASEVEQSFACFCDHGKCPHTAPV